MLVVVLLANYLPELLAGAGLGTLRAWFVVADGLQRSLHIATHRTYA